MQHVFISSLLRGLHTARVSAHHVKLTA
jgi:hypothetical protein